MSYQRRIKHKIGSDFPDKSRKNKNNSANMRLPRSTSMDSIRPMDSILTRRSSRDSLLTIDSIGSRDSLLVMDSMGSRQSLFTTDSMGSNQSLFRPDSGLGQSRGPSRWPSMASAISKNDSLSTMMKNLELDSSSDSSSVSSATTVKTAIRNKTPHIHKKEFIIDDSISQNAHDPNLDSASGSGQTTSNSKERQMCRLSASRQRPSTLTIPEESASPFLQDTNNHQEPQIGQHLTIDNELGNHPVSPGSPPAGSTEYCHLMYDQNWELSQHWSNNMEPVDQYGRPVSNVPDYLVDQPDYDENQLDQYNGQLDNDAGL